MWPRAVSYSPERLRHERAGGSPRYPSRPSPPGEEVALPCASPTRPYPPVAIFDGASSSAELRRAELNRAVPAELEQGGEVATTDDDEDDITVDSTTTRRPMARAVSRRDDKSHPVKILYPFCFSAFNNYVLNRISEV
ncbi:hypothetical protein ACS0PU_007237 [Formica fusca]